MSYLIYINETTGDILHPDAVKLFPGFSKLSKEVILFIVLAYDYCSPYAQYTEDDRLRRASLQIWNDNKLSLLEKPEVQKAVHAYKSLQYNPKIDLCRSYQKKIDDLTVNMETQVTSDAIEKTLKAINLLRAAIREIEQEILAKYLEEDKLQGGAKRTFLETMQKNKDQYEAAISQKPKS